MKSSKQKEFMQTNSNLLVRLFNPIIKYNVTSILAIFSRKFTWFSPQSDITTLLRINIGSIYDSSYNTVYIDFSVVPLLEATERKIKLKIEDHQCEGHHQEEEGNSFTVSDSSGPRTWATTTGFRVLRKGLYTAA